MLELNALRMAIQEWEQAETEDDEARARARVKELVTPQLIRIIFARLDELEVRLANRLDEDSGPYSTGELGLDRDSEAGEASQG